ncbi:hypothetical protein ABID08_005111 [Rhizobium binae]|uniref:Propionyl-coenzyme A carboxylase alpha polypeptide n=1 Tax=Rhizobium binae TaxID=1138190 RepID=A0ABV2MMP3_9HYPH
MMGEWAGVDREASPSPLGEKVPEGRMRGRFGKCEPASARSFAPIVAPPLIASLRLALLLAGEKGERAS